MWVKICGFLKFALSLELTFKIIQEFTQFIMFLDELDSISRGVVN